jgi:hypothetical protein
MISYRLFVGMTNTPVVIGRLYPRNRRTDEHPRFPYEPQRPGTLNIGGDMQGES